MAEINFNEFEEHDPPAEDDQQEEETQEETEAEPAEAAAEENPFESRISSMEQALSEISDYLRGKAEEKPAESKAESRPAPPNFGDNTPAQILWNELQEIKRQMKEPWERVEKERQQQQALEKAEAALIDDAVRYVNSRQSQGDPKIDPRQVVGMLISMGQVANPRVPITEALKNAYNAVAFDAAKEMGRSRGLTESRKPDAKVPAFRPSVVKSPQTRPQGAAKPGAEGENSLKARMDRANARLAKLSPEEIEEAFGN